MSDVKIRRAEARDAEAAAEIAREAWTPIYDGYRTQLGEDIYATVYPGSPLDVKAEKIKAAACAGNMLIAETDSDICGFATYTVEGEVGVLKENAVSQCCKGMGIAGRLYESVFNLLRAEGCKVVRVGTGLDDAHAPARRAYEKAGFSASLSSVTYYKKL